MRILHQVLSLVSVGSLIGVVACSSSASASASFTVALVVEGSGTVTTSPAGIDCAGPKDCGSSTFAADSTVRLRAAPAAGAVVARWSVDGADLASTATTTDIAGADGTTKRVIVTFAPAGSGSGVDAGSGSGADAGPGERDGGADAASDAGPEASAPGACGSKVCKAGEKCCLDTMFACRADCGASPVATCQANADCSVGSVCCLRSSFAGGAYRATSLSCEIQSACVSSGATTALTVCSGPGDPTCKAPASCGIFTAGAQYYVRQSGA